MKRILGIIVVMFALNGCSVPLVGSLAGNGATAYATKKIEHGVARSVIDVAMHEKTGKTTTQHLYAMIETDKTKKHLEKHFPNKDLKIKFPPIDAYAAFQTKIEATVSP